jgi:hypothetical protein
VSVRSPLWLPRYLVIGSYPIHSATLL